MVLEMHDVMKGAKLIDVFLVRGEFGCVGDGALLGVFSSEKRAQEESIGRGSLDCGGDGCVEKRKAIQFSDKSINILSLDLPVACDTVLIEDPRCKASEIRKMHIKDVVKPIELMAFLRKKTGYSLSAAKEFMDSARESGAFLEWSPYNLTCEYNEETAARWGKELKGIATLELISDGEQNVKAEPMSHGDSW
jgi:hypothetical protein